MVLIMRLNIYRLKIQFDKCEYYTHIVDKILYINNKAELMYFVISVFRTEENRDINKQINEFKVDMKFDK